MKPVLTSLPRAGHAFLHCEEALTWARGVQDREQQSTGAEGFPAHVGKDRDTEAAQDEAGIEHAAQGLHIGHTALSWCCLLPSLPYV